MVANLRDATPDTCGGKAATLATLLRHGFSVPDGFVVPFGAYRAARSAAQSQQAWADRSGEVAIPAALAERVTRCLAGMGNPPVAVRSSAANEDGLVASAAGQYETVLAVREPSAVLEAVLTCWSSVRSDRVAEYRTHARHASGPGDPPMAVLVQRLVDAEASGVIFTPGDASESTRIEASWGLGPSVVEGTITPDTYEVTVGGRMNRTIAEKQTRLDRDTNGLARRPVPESQRAHPALDHAAVLELAAAGKEIATLLGSPQDIEWAIADGRIWILQSRPITAPLPALPAHTRTAMDVEMTGIPGSHGSATGSARVLRGPSDFSLAQPGDIIICPYTDPGWTPLFRIAAAVITETGGALSHAAIVAREHAIPAVLGVPNATARIRDGELITVDGTTGVITPA